jgi:hypothetical protein
MRRHIHPSHVRERVFAGKIFGEDQDTLAAVRLVAAEALIRKYRKFQEGSKR